MLRPLRISLILAMTLHAFEGAAIAPRMTALAQSRGPFCPGDEPPQRMCVGMIKDGALTGFERTQKTRPSDQYEYNTLTWYRGDLGLDSITLSGIQTSEFEGQTSTTLRRWYWEEERLWLGSEALYGPVGPYTSTLWRTTARSKTDTNSGDLPAPQDAERQSCRKTLIERIEPRTKSLGKDVIVEHISRLNPLTFEAGGIVTIDVDCLEHDGERALFSHGNDGFDFIPHGLNRWTLFMTIGHTMQIWDCQSERAAVEKDEEIHNTWTLMAELWVPWKGQFFVLERFFLGEYVLVRDCGEVHLLRLNRDASPERGQREPEKVWRGRQLLDPVDYLIALIYIEPENTVYGFGPNFYVRLATANLKWEQRAIALKKVSCRDVTKGKAIWTDAHGESHEVGEPFRTIWQCAQVLKADGVLK